MRLIICAILILLSAPIIALANNISGTYIASTTYGNLFCINIIHKKSKIEGSFDEVDFKQIVSLENGVFKDNKLSFNVNFVVNGKSLALFMRAEKIKDTPNILSGHYKIGSEEADFVLYEIKSKPLICQNLYK